MENNEILEGNRLIANFMGWEHLKNCDTYINREIKEGGYKKVHGEYGADTLQFNASWDWIMPVVEKIESINYEVQIYGPYCLIQGFDSPLIDIGGGDFTKISATYEACIEFIKWCNIAINKQQNKVT